MTATIYLIIRLPWFFVLIAYVQASQIPLTRVGPMLPPRETKLKGDDCSSTDMST